MCRTSSRVGSGPFGDYDLLCILFVAFAVAVRECLARQLLSHQRGKQNNHVPFLEYRPAECRPYEPNSTGAESVASPRSEGRSQLSQEHTSELQSLRHLVCRLLLEKTK